VWKRPTEIADAEDYLPCEDCLALFQRSELWKHTKVCKFRTVSLTERGRQVQSRSALLLPTVNNNDDGFVSNILGKLRNDQITHIIRNDELIQVFGLKMYRKYGIPFISTRTFFLVQLRNFIAFSRVRFRWLIEILHACDLDELDQLESSTSDGKYSEQLQFINKIMP
jgi:hypothetical protein